jgi:hypothetical protein
VKAESTIELHDDRDPLPEEVPVALGGDEMGIPTFRFPADM